MQNSYNADVFTTSDQDQDYAELASLVSLDMYWNFFHNLQVKSKAIASDGSEQFRK
jgi:hypothetical protein